MPVELLTERARIRPFRAEDWRELQAYISKPEVTKLDSPYPTDDAGIQSVAAFFASSQDFVAVCLRESGRLIGHLHFGVRTDGEPGWRNLGFVFDSAFWGQGLAFESSAALVRHAFDDLATPGFRTGTMKENQRALRLLERLGFARVEGADPTSCVFELDAAAFNVAARSTASASRDRSR